MITTRSAVDLIPFRALHVSAMNLRPVAQAELASFNDHKWLAICEANPGWTGLLDGKIMAAAGVIIPFKGLGEAWLLTTPLVEKHPLLFVRTVKRVMGMIAVSHGLHRLQAMVDVSFTRAHRFVELLGFESEAVLEKYGPKQETYVMYRIFP